MHNLVVYRNNYEAAHKKLPMAIGLEMCIYIYNKYLVKNKLYIFNLEAY